MCVFLCKCHRPFKKTPTGWHLLVFLSWSSEVRTKCRMKEAECSDRNRLLKETKKSPIQTKQERWNTEPKTQEHTGIQKDKHQEPKVNRAARERTWKHNLTKRNTQVKTSRSRLTITKEGETARKLEADTHQKTNLQWKQEVPKKQILNTEPRRLREQSKRTTTLREEQTGNHWVWRFKHTKIKIKNKEQKAKLQIRNSKYPDAWDYGSYRIHLPPALLLVCFFCSKLP